MSSAYEANRTAPASSKKPSVFAEGFYVFRCVCLILVPVFEYQHGDIIELVCFAYEGVYILAHVGQHAFQAGAAALHYTLIDVILTIEVMV